MGDFATVPKSLLKDLIQPGNHVQVTGWRHSDEIY